MIIITVNKLIHISVHSFFTCFIRVITEMGNRGQGFFWEKYQYTIEIYSDVLFRLTVAVQIHKIGLERILKIIQFQSPCHEQRHLQIDQVALSPIHPGLKHFQNWGSYKSASREIKKQNPKTLEIIKM